MSQQVYLIHFEGVSARDTYMYTEELRNVLLDSSPDINVKRHREDPYAQDFGNTLIMSLDTTAVLTTATALSNWAQLHHKVSLTIQTADKKVTAHNITSEDVSQLVAFLHAHQELIED